MRGAVREILDAIIATALFVGGPVVVVFAVSGQHNEAPSEPQQKQQYDLCACNPDKGIAEQVVGFMPVVAADECDGNKSGAGSD